MDAAGGVTATCGARRSAVGTGIASAALRPYAVVCSFGGAFSGDLVLAADGSSLAVPASRSGRLDAAGTTLSVRSVHRVQGSPLTPDAPIGYVLEHDGDAVGALELNGAPRVWRPAAGTPLHDAVTHAELALLWDPAAR